MFWNVGSWHVHTGGAQTTGLMAHGVQNNGNEADVKLIQIMYRRCQQLELAGVAMLL